jgi:hypothetical protein
MHDGLKQGVFEKTKNVNCLKKGRLVKQAFTRCHPFNSGITCFNPKIFCEPRFFYS